MVNFGIFKILKYKERKEKMVNSGIFKKINYEERLLGATPRIGAKKF